MKNINISFGYFGPNWFQRFSWKLCNMFPFIPTLELSLYRTYLNSNEPFVVYHSIYLSFFNGYWRWSKIKGKWRFENLTEGKIFERRK